MKDTPWDHGLRVFAEADGQVGHAGAVLLRKLADQGGLTAALGPALARAGKFPPEHCNRPGPPCLPRHRRTRRG